MGREGALTFLRWWTQFIRFQTLPKLLYMRRRGKGETEDVLSKPGTSATSVDVKVSESHQSDIRAYYVFFILSFIDPDTSSLLKSAFLEQRRDIFLSIFKGLSQDSYPVIRKVLEVCWVGLWSDVKVKRTVKIGLFTEVTIGHVSVI